MIQVIGYYQTKFGELWERSLYDLVEEVIEEVMKKAKLGKKEIGAIFYANMLSGVLENNLHAPSKIAEIFQDHLPIFHTEAACASGGIAFNLACQYILSGKAETVLVIGAEKMTDYSPEEITTALSSAASGEEQEAGLTFPGLYALLAQYYLNKYGYNEENLAYVSYKNHYHGSLNKKAHFQKKISLDSILKSSYIAYPLKVLDASPISDGAAAMVITTNKKIINRQKKTAQLLATETATDTISLKERKSLDSLLATDIAAVKAFKTARLKPKDIGVAEVHDCFSIAEILAMEDLGFWPKGQGGKLIKNLSTMINQNSSLVVNPSGGLKAAGHPVGATGIKQIGEVYMQLTGQAEEHQVLDKHLHYGLAHNVGGSGGTAVVTILGI